MGTHSLWISLVINPQSLNDEFMKGQNENEIFDLIVYLIHNGIAVQNSISSLHASTNPDDVQKRNLETRKLYIIKFLLFKLLSYFRWDLLTVQVNLPTVHQEFCFTEFKKFCEQESSVPENWRIFSDILYHRWIMYFEQKSTYPGKNNLKIYNNVNQTMLDTYFVSNDMQENLIKKVQNSCFYSVNEVEKYVKQIETGSISEVCMPTFDCFCVDKDKAQFNYLSSKVINLDKSSFLDSLYYELAIWNYIHEDYSKAHHYFSKIKHKSNFDYLEEYIHLTFCMISKNYKIFESKSIETMEKKLTKFLTSIIKENSEYENSHQDFEYEKSIDYKKVIQVLKNFYENCKKNPDELYLYKCLSKYLVLKLKGLYEALDQNTKSLILDIEKGHSVDGQEYENEVIEEGEINDEEIALDDAPELMMIQATDPELILSLIPSIKRLPSTINNKWLVPKYDQILNNYNTLGQTDLLKSYLILSKANELRNAKYFQESRVLYLSLLEDIQASHPMLAEMIRYELLQTDLERFFYEKQETGSVQQRDLESKCIKFFRDINKQNYAYFKELTELVCLFFLEYCYGNSMQEFLNHQIEIIRFSVFLSHLTKHSNSRENKSKEFWDFCLGSFILPNSKYANNFPRIPFSVSFADFLCKLKHNTITIILISTSLIKLYCMIKEHTPQQIITFGSKYYDLFPSSMSTNIINAIDIQLVSVTIDQVLHSYVEILPQETLLIRYFAEFLLGENQFSQAMKYFIQIIMYQTEYFTRFEEESSPTNESIINQMIVCATKLGHHVLAGILYQFNTNPDYGHAFKELSQSNYIDSSDDLYDCIWDVTLLEFLIHYHTRCGEDERKQKVIKLISKLDINSNNDVVNLREAANLRKSNLFRMLAKQYL